MSNGLGTVGFFSVFFFPIGGKSDENFLNAIYVLIEWKVTIKITARVYVIISTDVWSRALKNAAEELVFLGENVTDKCTVIIAQFGKEHVGAGWFWVLGDILGRWFRWCLRNGLEMVIKWWGKWVLLRFPGRIMGRRAVCGKFMEIRKHVQKKNE